MSDSTSRVRIEIDSKGDFGAFADGAVKLDQLTQSINTAKGALGALGLGFGAGAIVHFTESIISAAAEITNLSNRIGISVEAFQVLNNVARQTGLGAGQLEAILAKVKDQIELAADKGGKAEKAFEKLGLSAKVLAGVPLERAIEAIAFAIVHAKNQTEAYAAATEVLGVRYLPKLQEVMKRVAGGYDEIAKAQKASGLIMEEENVKRLTSVWENFGNAGHGAYVKIANGLGYMLGMAGGKVVPQWMQDFSDAMDEASPARKAATATLNPDRRGPPITKDSPFLPHAPRAIATTYGGNDTSAAGLIALSGQMIRDNAETKENLELKKRITEEVKAQSGEYEKHIAANQKLIEKAEDLVDPLKKDRDEIEAIRKAYAEAGISTEKMEAAISKIREQMNDKALKEFFGGMDKEDHRRKTRLSDFEQSKKDFKDGQSDNPNINPSAMTPSQGAQAALMDYVTRIGSIGNQIRETFANIAQSLSGGIANGISSLIMRTQTWGQALRGIWNGFVTSMVNAFSQMLAEWAVKKAAMFVLDELYAAAGLALSAESAGTSLLMWIPAAIAASISSYGIAAAVGAAAVIGIIAATKGFESGGYTGGMEGQPAGQVHGQEFVFSAPAVRNIGLENLEAMHSSRALLPAPSGGSSGGGGGFGSGSKPDRFVVIDHRDTVKISEIMADNNFNNHVRRIGRQDRGV